ncbi:hypothetical protein, partial [Escherichia coli]|uniref:hypothetical protein n=1 Tax=Escherichia coli TaxID=562 RepID=UPI0032E3C4CB
MATSESYLSAQEVALPGRDLHLATISLAMKQSLVFSEYDRVANLALSLMRAHSRAGAVTPVEAALTWGLETGIAKARSYPQDVSLVWHLLIMAAFGLDGRNDGRSVATVIEKSRFKAINAGWSPSAAALISALLPDLGADGLRAVMRVSD